MAELATAPDAHNRAMRTSESYAIPDHFDPDAEIGDPDPRVALWLTNHAQLAYNSGNQARGRYRKHLTKLLEPYYDVHAIERSNVFAYVALAKDGSHAVVASRGSEFDPMDWLRNVQFLPKRVPIIIGQGGLSGHAWVHRGFCKEVEQISDQVHDYLIGVRGPVFYCGHSKGATHAQIMAMQDIRCKLVCTVGSPRWAWRGFRWMILPRWAEDYRNKIKHWRIVMATDPVPRRPNAVFCCHPHDALVLSEDATPMLPRTERELLRRHWAFIIQKLLNRAWGDLLFQGFRNVKSHPIGVYINSMAKLVDHAR